MNKKLLLIIGAIVIVALGAVGGIAVSKMKSKVAGAEVNNAVVNNTDEMGSLDTNTFSDNATGKLEKGGLGNDGTHKLIRDGGPSQTVYLISSIVDLDQFVGKTVEVWGQTIKAQKAPWLMDVGRVKIVQ